MVESVGLLVLASKSPEPEVNIPKYIEGVKMGIQDVW